MMMMMMTSKVMQGQLSHHQRSSSSSSSYSSSCLIVNIRVLLLSLLLILVACSSINGEEVKSISSLSQRRNSYAKQIIQYLKEQADKKTANQFDAATARTEREVDAETESRPLEGEKFLLNQLNNDGGGGEKKKRTARSNSLDNRDSIAKQELREEIMRKLIEGFLRRGKKTSRSPSDSDDSAGEAAKP